MRKRHINSIRAGGRYRGRRGISLLRRFVRAARKGHYGSYRRGNKRIFRKRRR